MSEDRRETHMRRYLDEVFNHHDLSGLDHYLAEDLASHWLGDRTLQGLPAWREAMTSFFAAFPDAAYTLDDIFFAGDKGVWRGTWRATQIGAWEGIAPTGRTAIWTVMIMGRFEGDRLAEDFRRIRPLQPLPPARGGVGDGRINARDRASLPGLT